VWAPNVEASKSRSTTGARSGASNRRFSREYVIAQRTFRAFDSGGTGESEIKG
jgi:hypothetical protein